MEPRKMYGPFGEKIIFVEGGFSKLTKDQDAVWFVDKIFKDRAEFQNCKHIKFLNAGENLKTISSFTKNLEFLSGLNVSKQTKIYAVGGGSVGDSIGFLASVYFRGLKLIHVPTTWLACVDSAVGGKTALNYKKLKNQIGTFYAPSAIYMIKKLLKSSNVQDSEGEVLKTLLLSHNENWSKKLLSSWNERGISFDDLKNFVAYKTKVVKKDFKDEKGIRAVLNLGHSLGHVFELELGLSHSEAVKRGLLFSLRWSLQKKLLTNKKAEAFEAVLNTTLPKLSASKIKKNLLKDKKIKSDTKIDFIFIGNKGPLVKTVSIKNTLDEYLRQI